MSDEFSVEVGVQKNKNGESTRICALTVFVAIDMDVVCEDIRVGLLFKIVYADDLVLMADSIKELRLKFDKWKVARE